jgi:acyl carrier protein phosphodiesterase
VNFLAHLLLAERGSTGSMLGAVMGDFLKGVRLQDLDEELRRGVRLHLRIDAFTDAHPVVAESRRRISPLRRRYAGVLVDVFYDHLLCRHWDRFSDVPLRHFVDEVYERFARQANTLPATMQLPAQGMIEHDWLRAYATVGGVALTLARIARRVKRENHLATGAEELLEQYTLLEQDFLAFFPEAQEHARAWWSGER